MRLLTRRFVLRPLTSLTRNTVIREGVKTGTVCLYSHPIRKSEFFMHLFTRTNECLPWMPNRGHERLVVYEPASIHFGDHVAVKTHTNVTWCDAITIDITHVHGDADLDITSEDSPWASSMSVLRTFPSRFLQQCSTMLKKTVWIYVQHRRTMSMSCIVHVSYQGRNEDSTNLIVSWHTENWIPEIIFSSSWFLKINSQHIRENVLHYVN